MAVLVFEISWNPAVAATLVFLRDNGVDLLTHSIHDDDGRITLSWHADDQIAHAIDWDLWSSGNTLEDLSAQAAWEGGNAKTLREKDKKANHWAEGGVL